MARKLKILLVASEITPFAKTWGLADVVGALPKALERMGHEVRLMMPKYGTIDERKFSVREVTRLKGVEIPFGGSVVRAGVQSAVLPNSHVQCYLLDHPFYFNRPELYRDPSTGGDWADNGERFAFFCRGVLETLRVLEWTPDVIHCHDWQAGLIPLYLKVVYKNDPLLGGVPTLLTIHNLGYQGNFDPSLMEKAGLPKELFYPMSGVEFYGKFSFLKAGVVYADLLNTVSETYAKEIQSTPEFGAGFEGILRARSADLSGILNGVDYSEWSPENDDSIPQKYSLADLSGKEKNKQALLARHQLEYRPGVPVLGCISRLADQKGFDLIGEIIDEMMQMDLYFILLGTGEEKYHRLFRDIARKYPKKAGVNLKFDNPLAHLIEAGSDMFLMPSRYEPSGLNQLYSLRYGTVPIVRKTGGLADTIREFDPRRGQGNGFVFEKYEAKELLKAIKRAVTLYSDHEQWERLMKNGMREDYSWEVSARKYAQLYHKLALQTGKRGSA